MVCMLRTCASFLQLHQRTFKGEFQRLLRNDNLCVVDRLLARGNSVKKVARTAMNRCSSRSHSIFTIRLNRTSATAPSKSSCFHFIDLAGSETIGPHEHATRFDSHIGSRVEHGVAGLQRHRPSISHSQHSQT